MALRPCRSAICCNFAALMNHSVTPVSSLRERAHAILGRFYGYHSFRPGQYEVIEAVMSGRDAVVLMPTGGGKSLCYQIPALLSERGCAVVVSPLIALMQDQTQALIANGIPAAAVHSNQDESYNRRVLDSAVQGKIKLLYISPERLLASLPEWSRLRISLFAIDEAHCISQWGHDFRPDYTALSQLKKLRPEVPVIALTATADRLTRDDIIRQLCLVDPYCHIGSFDRPNISLRAYRNPGVAQRVRFIAGLVRKYPQDSGIAYCLSRKGAEDLHAALQAVGVRAVCYHAGMSAPDRDASMKAFLDGRATVVCATVAFGMGIDKSNIRWVVHNNMPSNIESYYQEIGRAGRDGLPAEAILFHSYADVATLRSFAEESGRKGINMEKLERMQAYAEARVCRRRILLSYFSEERNCDCGNCDVCLSPPQRFDGTVLAQKALSVLARTGWTKLGIFTVVSILRGSRRSDLLSEGYDRIKTFGAGADLSQQEWNDYMSQMVQLGVFEIAYDDANHLRVTHFGMRILRGEAKLTLSRYEPPKETARGHARKAEEARRSSDPVHDLFEQLKTVRTDLARTEGVPPYIIFSDATLLDMATRRPADIESLMQVNGVGEKKAVRYGQRFLAAIRKFEGLGAGTPQGESLKATLILYNAGLPLPEIAATKNVKLATVYSHIAQLIDNDMISTYGGVITPAIYRDITETLASEPDTAYDILNERYAPGMVAVAKAIQRAVERRKARKES